MEKTKIILEKLLKVMFIVCIFLGGSSIVLLFILHIEGWPIVENLYPEEIILFIGMILIYLLAMKFKVKYCKWIAFIGIILAGVNLFGFGILLKIIK